MKATLLNCLFNFFLPLDENVVQRQAPAVFAPELCLVFCLWNLVFLCDWLHKANGVRPLVLRGRWSRGAVKDSLVTWSKSIFPQSGTATSVPPSLAWCITQVCPYWVNPLITRQLRNADEPHPIFHKHVFQVRRFPKPKYSFSICKEMFSCRSPRISF